MLLQMKALNERGRPTRYYLWWHTGTKEFRLTFVDRGDAPFERLGYPPTAEEVVESGRVVSVWTGLGIVEAPVAWTGGLPMLEGR